ncbi:protein LURP-one-related 4-like [Cucurbita pepo subsp. pepo]|uniref:protein LURP-one-related 4-like n=1 Tax=Cucurbita pepo subsp. pepo TaxID=3664 RepID=UPI000C9D5CB4|nr:protein LURP-one-related 4-like [Cucurbita pepo subsp. pepo]
MEAQKVFGRGDRIFSPKWLKVSFSAVSVFDGEAACFPCMTADLKAVTFTVWMKSLIMQGNGLTVFNENGQVAYRIDNYDEKRSREVFLMDLRGKLLFTVRRKSIWFLCDWEGFKEEDVNTEERKPFFRAKKILRVFSNKLSCDVKLCGDESQASLCYRFEGFWGKIAFRILDSRGGLVAEAKRKQSSLGVQLGEDVMSLVLLQTNLDHSLIMALVTMYLLIQRRI